MYSLFGPGWKQSKLLSGLELWTGLGKNDVVGEKLGQAGPQGSRKEEHFAIWNPASLQFETGDGIPPDIPAAEPWRACHTLDDITNSIIRN